MHEVDSGVGSLLIHVVWGDGSCTPPPNGMIHWWRANGVAEDELTPLQGTFLGEEQYDSGMVDLSFSFNGSSYVEFPDSTLDITGSCTVALWFKLHVPLSDQPDYLGSAWNDYPVLIEKGNGGYTSRNYGVYFDKWNNLLAFSGIDHTQTAFVFSVTVGGIDGIVDDLDWHFLAAVWDHNSKKASVFIDGVLRGSSDGTNGTLYTNNESLKLGAAGPGTYFFNGAIDEVVLLNQAVDVSTIQKIYLSGSKGICP